MFFKKMLKILSITVVMLVVGFQQSEQNPPAEGFNAEASDAKAIAIADQVMQAMGGRKAWDNARYLTWKFFGGRLHVWDKYTGDIRIEDSDKTILMNINSKEGQAWVEGEKVTEPERLDEILEQGYRLWVNDSYWLLMPYKLKDSGVTLNYLGQREGEQGQMYDVLQLTFDSVGVTPENKYEVYVNPETHMVEQWSYFKNASDKTPRFSTPWIGWAYYGTIMLSANRGERSHTDVAVLENVPKSIFESPEKVELQPFTVK